ncbi:hypothetical protein HBI56_196420 [Parastagonospora nodorum]|uniref:Uncharacterized protein n=1 Tax=Phaeosphaeria nodorum (strain SN15 / ATCC MYA-4574 / FGSC 10173) TaxID=321614 RepID=A0A7U2FAX2_PHANO|nr:hypothetical protein HBH56_208360 [Parastagonospora nodorum]QRC99620.1 hypothetical protein JI435_413690 [Parastagonospora nodorum SN15]KAH3923684.1 hypothetical protein HBH54_207230 [Parastagonospora nodorum]KAH3941679.1 hypothetical protein HBH53_199600 [Parastagonospora nodorum]KAH3960481.1 hypothetical protein HBH51_191750 [Parastagonospora nodorum]
MPFTSFFLLARYVWFLLHEFAHHHSGFNTLFSIPEDTGFVSHEAALSNGVMDSNALLLRRWEEIY